MPLYLSRDRLNASDQAAAAVRTADLTGDIEQQYAEATALAPPVYTLPTLGSLGVAGAASPVMSAIASMPIIGQRRQQQAEPVVSPTWALPSLDSLGVSKPKPATSTPAAAGQQGSGETVLDAPTPAETGSGDTTSGDTSRHQPPSGDDPWGQKAYQAAVKAGHPDPTEFVEQMRWESGNFDPDVISGKRSSSAGARGIAQIMPQTATGWGVDPLDPDAALAAAAKNMTLYYQKYGGDREKALAAYNMGEGNLAKYGPRGLAETNMYLNIIDERTRAKRGATAQTPAPQAAAAPSSAAAVPSSPPPAAQAPTPPAAAGGGPGEMVTVEIPNSNGQTMQVQRRMIGEGPGKYAPSKGWRIVGESAPVAMKTSDIGGADVGGLTNLKTSQIGVPMPEDASIEESGAASANQPQTLPPPLRNIVPYDEQTGRTGYAEMQRAPLADGITDPVSTGDTPYDPRDADSGAREGGREGWNGSSGTSSEAATAPSYPLTDAGQGDSQGQYVPLPPNQTETSVASGQPPASPMASMEQDASTGISSTSVDDELAPRAAEDTRPYYGPAEPATPAIGAAQNAGATIEADQDLAPRTDEESPLKPVWDAAGNLLGYVREQARKVPQPPSLGQMATNVSQGRTPAGQTPGEYVQTITPRSDTSVAPEAAIRDIMDIGTNAPNVPGAAMNAATEGANAVTETFGRAAGQWSDGQIRDAILTGGWGALQAVNVPYEIAADAIDAVTPAMNRNSALSMGDAITNVDLIRDIRHLANAGVKITQPIVQALRSGTPVESLLELARPIAEAAAGRIDRGIGAVGDAWEQGRATARRAEALDTGGGAYGTLGVSPGGEPRRMYHGTGTPFEKPDPSKFDPNGSFGPGYYLSDSPEVAGRYADLRAGAAGSGQNVRPVDVPPTARILDMESPLAPALVDEVETLVSRVREGWPHVADELQDVVDTARERLGSGNPLYQPNTGTFVTDLMNAADRVDSLTMGEFGGRGLATEILSRAGYDGMSYNAGNRVPIPGQNGAGLDYGGTVIFPNSLDRVTNGLTGEIGGATLGVIPNRGGTVGAQLLGDASNSLAGGVFGAAGGAAMPAETDEERRRNALAGAGLGMIGAPIAGRMIPRSGGALATPGITPNGPRRGARPTVEVIQSQIDTAYSVAQRAREMGNTQQALRAMEAVRSLESDLVDAVNARKALEPAIERDIGRRVERMPYEPDVRTDPYTTERAATADDLSGPVSIPTNRPNMQNAGLPFDPSSAAAGGAAGAMTGSEDEDGEFDPLRAGAGIFLGAVGGTPQGKRIAARLAKQAKANAAPPNLLEVAQNYRHSIGMLGNVGTGLVNAIGGPVSIAMGLPTEAIKTGVMKGYPLPVVYQAASLAASLKEASRAALGTALGYVPQSVRNSPDFRPPLSERMTGPVGKAMGWAIDTPGRLATQTPDAFFSTMFTRWGKSRAAAELMQESGIGRLDPAGQLAEMNRLLSNPTADEAARIEAGAKKFADEMTYKGDAGYWEEVLGSPFRAKGGPTTANDGTARQIHDLVGSFLMPFYSSIFKMHKLAGTYVPVVGEVADRSHPASERIARQIVGLSFGVWAADKAAQGMITGPGPDDPDEKERLRATGWDEWSTFIPGLGYVKSDNFAQAAPILKAMGGYYDNQRYGKGKPNEDQYSAGERTAKSIMRAFEDFPVVKTVQSLVAAVEKPVEGGADLAIGAGASLVPAAVRTKEAASDPYNRTVDTTAPLGERIKQRALLRFGSIPGVGSRQDLNPTLDRKGEPVPNPRYGIQAFLPTAKQPTPEDPLMTEMGTYGVTLDKPRDRFAFTRAGADAAPGTEGSVRVMLTPEQRQEWAQIRWQRLQEVAPSIQGDPRYGPANDNQKRAAWEKQVASAEAYADRAIKAKYRQQIEDGIKTAPLEKPPVRKAS